MEEKYKRLITSLSTGRRRDGRKGLISIRGSPSSYSPSTPLNPIQACLHSKRKNSLAYCIVLSHFFFLFTVLHADWGQRTNDPQRCMWTTTRWWRNRKKEITNKISPRKIKCCRLFCLSQAVSVSKCTVEC